MLCIENAEGRCPGADHCVRLADTAGITRRVAREVLERVDHAVSRWSSFAEQAQCPEPAAETVAATLTRL